MGASNKLTGLHFISHSNLPFTWGKVLSESFEARLTHIWWSSESLLNAFIKVTSGRRELQINICHKHCFYIFALPILLLPKGCFQIVQRPNVPEWHLSSLLTEDPLDIKNIYSLPNKIFLKRGSFGEVRKNWLRMKIQLFIKCVPLLEIL